MDGSTKEKIAILDNCEVVTFHKFMREGMSIEKSLDYYDRIIIPGWVWTEISDSKYRRQYVEELQGKGYPIEILQEKDYLQIIDEELTLLQIFEEVIKPFAELRTKYCKYILRGKPKEEIDYFYSEWVELIYDKWPGSGKTICNSEGQERVLKHNAGEISIAFLAALLTCQGNKEITIFTHDADCRCYIQSVQKGVSLSEGLRVSYKNSNIILKDFLNKNIFEKNSVEQLIDKVHETRSLTYIYRKSDGTNELRDEKVDAASFKKMVSDDLIDIVW